ncbi:hypothetical protein SSTU70S_01353 [Stutzerimonas stutzeri]
MLDTNLKTQLKTYLEKVTQPFEIVASLDDGEKSRELLKPAAGHRRPQRQDHPQDRR